MTMNTMLYILGSGIMDNPFLLNFVVFLFITIVLVFLSRKTFWLSEKRGIGMVVLTCLLSVAAMISLFISFYHLAKLLPEERNSPRVEKVEYEDHEYLIFKDNFSRNVIHNPDCKCRKMFKTIKDK